MKKVNGIRIFFVLAVFFVIGCYQMANIKDKEELPESITTEEILMEKTEFETETEEAVLPVSQTLNYKYVIVEEGDYLTVYYADRKTVYEYTDIRYSDLDDTLRREIRKGYCIPDEATLFGFLENYST